MFKELVNLIEKAVTLNFNNADGGDVQRSSFTAGMVKGYIDVLRSLGHDVQDGSWNDKGCDRIGYLKIDEVVLVEKSKIDFDGYAELLKK